MIIPKLYNKLCKQLSNLFGEKNWRFTDSTLKYAVTRCGRVFSLYQRSRTTDRYRDSLKELNKLSWGGGKNNRYQYVGCQYKGTKYMTAVHKIVFEAFTENTVKENNTIDHLDGDTHNNNLSNLLAIPRSLNIQFGSWKDFRGLIGEELVRKKIVYMLSNGIMLDVASRDISMV